MKAFVERDGSAEAELQIEGIKDRRFVFEGLLLAGFNFGKVAVVYVAGDKSEERGWTEISRVGVGEEREAGEL